MLAFLGGILLVQQLATLPSLWWALLLPPLALLAWRRPVWLAALFFVAGVAWAAFRAGLILHDELPAELEGRNLAVEGRVADIPQHAEYGFRFELDVERATLDGVAVGIPRRVLLTSREGQFAPRAGERWRLVVRVNRPHGYQNPGGGDYEGHLFRNRIRARGYVRDDARPLRLDAGAWYAIDRVRQTLGERIGERLADHPLAGVVVALANGDARGIGDAQWRTLRRTGTLHLVAISGLHISLIGGIAFFLARFLWALPGATVLRFPAPAAGAVAALLAATGYAALAGFVIPTQRALIMLAVAMGGILLARRFAPTQLLAAAGLLVLVYDPLAVMAAGFWLSFGAVAVIILAAQGGAAPSAWRKWGYIQWAIALGMLPLMLALFGQVSLVAPLANLLAVPVFDLLAVPLTLLGAVLLGLSLDTLAGYPLHAAAWLLQLLWAALDFLAALDFSLWHQHRPPWWALVCAFVGVAQLLAPRGWPARWVGAVWMLPLFLVRPPPPGPGEIWFTLLDVGQGLAAVVRTQAHTLVYDAGPRFSATFDTGAVVVAPYLRANAVARVDMLLISHGDNDHAGGAASVLEALPVGEVVSNVAGLPGAAHPCAAGRAWRWDGVEFALLSPPTGAAGRRNDDSCVLQVRGPYGTILLPGDIEARAERRLVERHGAALAADILVAPHHGSKTSSTLEFIRAVRPRQVLFPVGYRNRHHHPHGAGSARYAAAGAVLYDSPAHGALEFRLRAAGTEVSAYRREQRRYWFHGSAPPERTSARKP